MKENKNILFLVFAASIGAYLLFNFGDNDETNHARKSPRESTSLNSAVADNRNSPVRRKSHLKRSPAAIKTSSRASEANKSYGKDPIEERNPFKPITKSKIISKKKNDRRPAQHFSKDYADALAPGDNFNQQLPPTENSSKTFSQAQEDNPVIVIGSGGAAPPTSETVPEVKGSIPPYLGLVSQKKTSLFSQAYASESCDEATVSLYKTKDLSLFGAEALASQIIPPDTNFELDLSGLDIDAAAPHKYTLKTERCSETLLRVLTRWGEQTITYNSTVLGMSALSSVSKAPNEAQLEELHRLQSALDQESAESFDQAYEKLSKEQDNQFKETFGGSQPFVLKYALPIIEDLAIDSFYKEGMASLALAQVEHWREGHGYDIGIQWILDSETVATGANWSFTPEPNSQGKRTLKLLIGKMGENGSVDQDYPFHELDFVLTVQDTKPAKAPEIDLLSSSPTNNPLLNLSIATGENLAACESFSSLKITESPIPPAPSEDFPINCEMGPTQTLSHTLEDLTNGHRSVYLWALDARGNVSSPQSVSFIYDTSPAEIAFVNMQSAYAGESSPAFKWQASDYSSLSSLNFDAEFFDGSVWSPLSQTPSFDGVLENREFSVSHTLPNTPVANAQIRVSFTDSLGHSTTELSPAFEIKAPVLGLSPASYDFGSLLNKSESAPVSFTVSNTGTLDSANCSLASLTGGHFAVVSDGCAGQSVAAGSSCLIQVKAAPQAEGAQADTLSLNCGSISMSAALSATSLNNAPAPAADESFAATEDTPLSFTVSAGSDVDGDPLTYSITAAPAKGTLSNCMNNDGDLACDYTPDANFNGTDFFTYKVNDGESDSPASATVTLNVAPVNDAPTLPSTQSLSTNEDTQLAFDLNPGSDVDLDTLTYIIVTAPANGVLTCDGGVSRGCVYDPAQDDVGSYTFTYKVNDGALDSNTATATITITNTNDSPVMIGDQSEFLSEDTTHSFTLSGATDIDLPAQTLSYKIVSAPAQGTLANCSTTGSYSTDISCDYTPNANYNGVDSFTYRAYDSLTESATDSTVTLNIAAVNDAPTLAGVQNVSTSEDTPLSFDLAAGSDIESDPLTYVKVGDPSNGTVSCSGGASRSCVYTPNADFNGSDSFTYKVNDGSLDSNVETVNITVTPVNDAPVMIGDQSAAGDEDTTFSITLSGATDIDVPAQTLSYKLISTPANGVLSNCIATSSYSSDVVCDYTPSANYNGNDSFTYRAFDSVTESTTDSTVTVTVNPVNDAPVLASSQNVSTNEDTALTFDLSPGSDIDGDTLSYIKVTDPANGGVVCAGGTNRSCTYTPNPDFNGSDSFTYKVNDGSLDSNIETVNITVNPTNDAPVMIGDQTESLNEDALHSFTLSGANDIDLPAQTLSYKLISAPANGSLTNCVLVGSYTTDITCDYAPDANFNGSDSFTYRAYDSVTESATDSTVTLNVAPVNDAPTLAVSQNVSTNEDTALTFDLALGNDIDGDTLSYVKVADPANGSVSCSAGTSRSCVYTPNPNFNGSDSFTYKVNDGAADSNIATVNISVNPVNDPPVVAADQSFNVNDNQLFSFSINPASDIDGDTLAYQLVTGPAHGTLTNCVSSAVYSADLTCDYTANANYHGSDSLTYLAYDYTTQSLTNGTITFAVTDTTPPSAPAVILASNEHTNSTATTLTATSCADTPGILVNEGAQPLASDAAWQTCSTSAGALAYTLASATEGLHTLKVWAKDPQGNVSTLSTDLGVVYDVTAPSMALSSPGNLRGGQSVALSWTVTEINSSSTQSMSVDYYNGSTWASVGTTAAANGPLTSQGFGLSWTVPSIDTAGAMFRVTYTDLAGNTHLEVSPVFEIDSTAPALTNTSPSENAYVLQSETFTGACEPNATINFSGDLMTAFDITCPSGGSYSQLINFSSNDGAKTITLTASDAVGNTTVLNRTVTVDTVAPSLARTSGDVPTYTNQSTVTWGGTCEGNYPVTVSGDASATFNCSSGSWSWTTPAETVEGEYNYSMVQTDGAGNVSTPLSLSWNLDTTAPNFSIAQSGPLTNNNDSVTLSGNCDGTLPITVSGSGSETFSCVNGSWSWTSNTFSSDGTYTFNFAHTDEVGNAANASFTWTRDTTGPALSVDTQLDLISNTNGASWSGTCDSTYSVDIGGAQSATVACNSGTWSWSASATTDANRSYTISQTNGLGTTTAHTVTWIRETNPPTISSISTSAPDPSIVNFVPVGMSAASANASVNLSSFCLKSNDSAAPVAGDPCWMKYNDPSVAMSPAPSMTLSNYYHLLGWEPQVSYEVRAWVMDAAGNISANSSTGASRSGTDMFTIVYDPAIPPEIWDVLAANSDTTANPPTRSESSVPAGSSVYIRWKVSDPDDALPSGAIALFYTQDEISFTPISTAQALDPYSSNCPNITLAANEGCYHWNGGSPLNDSYKIRVQVTDVDSLKTQSITNPLNTNNLRIIAGNTESGLGGSGASAMFFTREAGNESDPNTLVVTDDGNIYVADYKRGILTIDPEDGKQKIFIPQTGTSSGDGGAASNATLNYATKITLDYNNRLLILDHDRIRRVDLNQSPPSIETIIGGGSQTTDVVANPLDLQISGHSKNGRYTRATIFTALPNGNIVFESDSSGVKGAGDPDMRIRIYNNATKQIESMFVGGTGTTYNASQDISSCRVRGLGLDFNLTTSQINWGNVWVYHHDSYTGCEANHASTNAIYARSWLDNQLQAVSPPITYAHHNGVRAYAYDFLRQGMNGRLYNVKYKQYVDLVGQDGSFTRVLGAGPRGICPDGTLATNCNLTLQDVFITSSGKIYFLDGGTIRTLDDNNRVVTISGQRKTYGDGVNALNARFADVTTVGKTDDGRYIAGDSYFIKEFTLEGNINVIAGNGNQGTQATGVDAKTTDMYNSSWFIADPLNGDIYVRGYAYQMHRLNRSTGFWERLTGAMSPSYNYWDSDNLSIGQRNNSHHLLVLGYHGGKFLTSQMKYNGTEKHYEDFMLKLYDIRDTVTPYKQTHLAGTNDPATTYSGGYAGICSSGSVAANCKIPYYSYMGMTTYDTTNNRWLIIRQIDSGTYGKQLYGVKEGGTIDLVATLPRHVSNSYTFVSSGGTDYLFYCHGGRIYRHDLTNNTDGGQLPWTMSTLSCSGQNMLYDAANDALVFPFMQNGLSGVAMYYNPVTP